MTKRALYNHAVLKRMTTLRFFLLISCFSFLSVLWFTSVNREESIIQEALDNVARDIRYSNVYRKPSRQPKDLKYVLLWTRQDYSPFYFLGNGQRAFLKNNCSVINCYVTTNRDFFGGDTSRFDAIAFNGRNLRPMRRSQLPKKRSIHQKYIFFNLESADNYPICHSMFEGFFNWTATYKLDSDVPFPYIVVKNRNGEIVGPKKKMEWVSNMRDVDKDFAVQLMSKKKAAAWFVSSCSDRSGRREFVTKLQGALAGYGLTVDVYGACGTMKCPLEKKSECDSMLESDYYFYLSLENSFAEDYVTEKLLTALQHNTVPIVYGAADYSRFLPPGSYLDARKQDADDLAAKISHLIATPDLYHQFFKWKHYYSYHDATDSDNVCAICEALNNKSKMETTTSYTDFRRWWNPLYKERCWWLEDDIGFDHLLP
ncbi:alpha-(1,3)-fucosyltransferase C-like [Ostrinia furnacalis]|uniref:alpha-(1,3)-fucosyltransferase C-like n=1 Tax=Ostrinia furnacalis TaxID=93504 RepID=UPI00103C8E38|nr:alpha-(1,3)-fucosyltransferase C-like [Ostrinia furnacalis]XP_028177071.1 alpha-(1,3)-fucosyltransferase C-like [Ostrinia furnacalis]